MKKAQMLDKEFLHVPNSFNLFKTKASLRSLPIPCSDGGVKYFIFSETEDDVSMPYAWFKLGKDRNVVVEYKCVLEGVSKENYKEFEKLLRSKEKDGMYNFLKLAFRQEKVELFSPGYFALSKKLLELTIKVSEIVFKDEIDYNELVDVLTYMKLMCKFVYRPHENVYYALGEEFFGRCRMIYSEVVSMCPNNYRELLDGKEKVEDILNDLGISKNIKIKTNYR